jgi:hypothetical protein
MDYNPDKNDNIDKIIEQLMKQINNITQIELNNSEDFNKMIKKNFDLFIGNLFDSKNYLIEINEKNNLKINLKDKKGDELNNIFNEDFEENVFFNSFQLLVPDYSFYFENKTTFILQIEVNDIKKDNVKCVYNRIKNDTKYEFVFKAEKKDLDEKYHRGIYKNFRKKGFYEINIIVPLNGYSVNKLKKTTYDDGVLNFIYDVTDNNNDDDDIVEFKNDSDNDNNSQSSNEEKEKDNSQSSNDDKESDNNQESEDS